jgi:hypothetical protein
VEEQLYADVWSLLDSFRLRPADVPGPMVSLDYGASALEAYAADPTMEGLRAYAAAVGFELPRDVEEEEDGEEEEDEEEEEARARARSSSGGLHSPSCGPRRRRIGACAAWRES